MPSGRFWVLLGSASGMNRGACASGTSLGICVAVPAQPQFTVSALRQMPLIRCRGPVPARSREGGVLDLGVVFEGLW